MVLCLMDVLGVCVVCLLIVFGYDDVLYGYVEVMFINVCVDVVVSILFGEGRGFEIV